MVIANLPPGINQKTGIYSISVYSPNSHRPKTFKVGKAEHFKHRLDNYHTYLSDGFYMYLFFVCKNFDDTREVETYMLRLCRNRGLIYQGDGRNYGRNPDRSETFTMTNQQLTSIFNETYKAFEKTSKITQFIHWMINDKAVLIDGKAYTESFPKMFPFSEKNKALGYDRKMWIPIYNTGYGKPVYVNPKRAKQPIAVIKPAPKPKKKIIVAAKAVSVQISDREARAKRRSS